MDFKDKKVIIRVGFDLPVDDEGNIKDDKRVKVSLPTLKYILDKGPKQLIIMCHMGRPKGEVVEKLKTDKTAELVSEMLGVDIIKIDGWDGLPESRVVFLENLRFNPAEKSKDESERDEFGKQLASLAEIYVNDAFSNCHRDQASMTSVPKFIPGCIGLSVEKEVDTIGSAVQSPERPVVAIIGGLKADKLNTINNILPLVDQVLVGGALAYALLKERGTSIGATKLDKEGMDSSKEIISNIINDPKVLLPVDAVIADKFDEHANKEQVSLSGIKDDWMVLDIGSETVRLYTEQIEEAKTVLFFGPPGVFEMEKFADGTKNIIKAMAESSAKTIVGGGDSASAVEMFGYNDKMSLVSTGGGASLTLVQGKELPGLKVLGYYD